jgi:hypothetical protein
MIVWKDEKMVGWKDGWMDRWNEWIDGSIDELNDASFEGWMGWMNV